MDQVLGNYLAGRLRRGLPVDISAQNGQIYRIDPKTQKLINLTTQEMYCVHPVDGNHYCFPDMVIVWWDYLHLKPEVIEKVVGPPGSSHRSPWFDGEGKLGTLISPMNFATEEDMVRNIETATHAMDRATQYALNDPVGFLTLLPPGIKRAVDISYSTIIDYYSRGLMSASVEFKEVEENEDAEDTEGEVTEGIEGSIEG